MPRPPARWLERLPAPRLVLRLLALLPLALLWCVLAETRLVRAVEERTLEARFRYRGEIESEGRVVYVNIDARSIAEIGGQPWSRSFYETVSRALIERGRARAVGLTLLLSDNDLPESVDMTKFIAGNQQLSEYLDQDPPVVLGASYSAHQFRDILGTIIQHPLPVVRTEKRPRESIEPPALPTLIMGRSRWNASQFGLTDTEDRGTRAIPLYAVSRDGVHYHMAVELARRYWGVPEDGVSVEDGYMIFRRTDGTEAGRTPLRDQQFLDVNWFSSWESERSLHESFSAVHTYAQNLTADDPGVRSSAEAFFAQEGFNGAVVLIGAVDPLLRDLGPSPLDENPVPRVGVHGNAVKTILSGLYLRRLPPVGVWMIILGLSLGITALSLSSGRWGYWLKAGALLLTVGYVILVFEAFRLQHLVLPLVAPLGAAFTTGLATVVTQIVQERRARARLKSMFGTYVAPEVVNQMVEAGKDPQLGGHDAEVTAYFSDIQGFSSLAEQLDSSRLGSLLTEYLNACTEILQAERGTLDKYIGDAVVAMFGAPIALPDHAYRACRASQLVQRRLEELRRKWQAENDRWPANVGRLRSRIGLNTGVCMIGNMGSSNRFNYTMMGPNVNLAARMERGAKSWGAYTLVTEATRTACEAHGRDVVFRSLGRTWVRGCSQPVPIHEVVGLQGDVSDSALECVGLFEKGLELLWARDWEGARATFARSALLEPLQPGRDADIRINPSLVYQQIVARYAVEPPPPDWDGICLAETWTDGSTGIPFNFG